MATATAASLDDLYGVLEPPSHIKYYEVDGSDGVMLNPYLQVATKKHKGVLDPSRPAYDWVIDKAGDVRLIEAVPHPRGRTFDTHFKRPEDGYERDSGYVETYGHVSALGGGPGRMGGEIVNDRRNRRWITNNKSGRYSKKMIDRTPEQLAHAAAKIQETVDPGGQEWGPVVYLLEYAPANIQRAQRHNPMLEYINPEKGKGPFLVIEPVGARDRRQQ